MSWSEPFRDALRRTTCVFVLPLVFIGCHPGSRAKSQPPVTVRETFDRLREWHSAGAYAALRPHIDPACREDVVDLLVAVDELLATNATVLARIRATCPGLDADRYDLGIIADNLDLFSRRVDLVKIEESRDRATVIAEVSGRLPLTRMPFRRVGDTWMYAPEAADPQIVVLVRALTRSLGQIDLVLCNRRLTPEQLAEEYRVRLLPKMEKITQRGTRKGE